MNGAQSLIRTLADAGVEVCFANPGTSEMHFVAALDSVPGMRGVLGLFEGSSPAPRTATRGSPGSRPRRCCTSARVSATGWRTCTTRAARAPRSSTWSATTRPTTGATTRRSTPTSRPWRLEGWVRRSEHAKDVGADAAAAVAAAQDAPGRIATLLLPADASWGEGGETAAPVPAARPPGR